MLDLMVHCSKFFFKSAQDWPKSGIICGQSCIRSIYNVVF